MKKVSVMVPTYNAQAFISECLESILIQDYPNIEVVISDDSSTDATVVVLERYKELYPDKIVLNVNSINLGITKNCNTAIRLCHGEYVCFFAGDDVMLPGKISRQVAELESDDDASLCYHQVETFNNEDNRILEVTELHRTIFSFIDIIERGGLPGANSIMTRRDHIPPGGYNEKIPAVSDWLFFIELALRGRILFIPEILARYRKHGEGCSAKADYLVGETLETVDIISRRFAENPKIVSSSRKAKRRYLLGSVARLIKGNNAQQLSYINDTFVRGVSLPIYIVIFLYIRCGLIKLGFGGHIFTIIKSLKGKFERLKQ